MADWWPIAVGIAAGAEDYIAKRPGYLDQLPTKMIALLIVILIGYWCQQAHTAPDSPVQAITTSQPVIMSIRQLQQALNDKGHSRYACEIDGRMGKETLKAWSNYICDRQAIKEFK